MATYNKLILDWKWEDKKELGRRKVKVYRIKEYIKGKNRRTQEKTQLKLIKIQRRGLANTKSSERYAFKLIELQQLRKWNNFYGQTSP